MMGTESGMTDRQRGKLFSEMGRLGLSEKDIEEKLGFGISKLTVSEASDLIDCLMTGKDLSTVTGKIKEKRTAIASESPATNEEGNEKTKITVTPGSEMALAKVAGIPPEMANLFFMSLNGTAYIKVAGLQYMAGKTGYRRIEITDHFDEKSQTWIAEAKIYPKISVDTIKALASLTPEVQKQMYDELSKPTNGIGTANKDNVKTDKMWKFLREMAQTRALGRALRSYTGYGSTTYEELPDAEVEVE